MGLGGGAGRGEEDQASTGTAPRVVRSINARLCWLGLESPDAHRHTAATVIASPDVLSQRTANAVRVSRFSASQRARGVSEGFGRRPLGALMAQRISISAKTTRANSPDARRLFSRKCFFYRQLRGVTVSAWS